MTMLGMCLGKRLHVNDNAGDEPGDEATCG